MLTLRQRIEQRITDLRVERDIAEAAQVEFLNNGYFDPFTPDAWFNGVAGGLGGKVGEFCARQDPATVIARIDREFAGCAADLALLDELENYTYAGDMWIANLIARYPSEESS